MKLGKDGCIKVCVCVYVRTCVCMCVCVRLHVHVHVTEDRSDRTRSGEEKTGARWANEKAVIAGGEKVRITNYLTGPWQRRHNSRHVLHTGVEHHIVYISLFLSCCHTVLMNSLRGMCISCCWSAFLVMKLSFTVGHMTADQQAA